MNHACPNCGAPLPASTLILLECAYCHQRVLNPHPLPVDLEDLERTYGTYIGGNLNTDGGEVVGRDKIVYGDEVKGDKVNGSKRTVYLRY